MYLLSNCSRRTVLTGALLSSVVTCSAPRETPPRPAVTRVTRPEATRAQAAALAAQMREAYLTQARPEYICIRVADEPAGPYEDKIEGANADPPEETLAPLRSLRSGLRPMSQCDAGTLERAITLVVGWPVAAGEEIQVAVDRLCAWGCASGFKVRLRREGGRFHVINQQGDRWVS